MGIPSLITSTNFNSLGNDINIVGTFSADDTISTSDKYVSPILLNYVEPYLYKGTDKTLFYTEVNTNIKEGDRVFIINGNYDSNALIEADKYKKGRDGYKVLFVDYCKIVLDIDYTGQLPNKGNSENGDYISDYIKLYYIDSYDSFLLANKQLSTRNGTLNHKFDYEQNTIAYIDYNYAPIDDGWVYTMGITGSPGFYVKNPTQSFWTNITEEFILSGSCSVAIAPSYKFQNNGKLKVMSKSFDFNGFSFLNGNSYVWDSQQLYWKVDVKEQSYFTKAILSKSNFRNGDFKGSFNSGVYGSKSKKIKWTGDGKWNGGTLLNTSWVNGAMNSKILLPISYQANIKNSLPYQKINSYNNGGYGFNYIIESDFETSSIYSAIIRNAKFGNLPTLPVIENHIMSYTQSFDNIIKNGLFESCEFNNVSLLGGAIKNTRSRNSMFTDVKIINSFLKDSVVTNSTLIADNIIKIDGYDELNNSDRRSSSSLEFSNSIDFKVYRFYIGEADFLKLRNGDSFYIKGVKIKNDNSVINFFDKKFIIGNWVEYFDDYNNLGSSIYQGSTIIHNESFYKRGVECAAFLSLQEENEWIYNSTATQSNGSNYYTETIAQNQRNENQRYSIDVVISTKDINSTIINGLNFDYATQSSISSTLERPKYLGNIDVSNAYIIDSNIEDSYIENSNWNSGFNINYNNDVVISSFTSSTTITNYNISINSDNQLVVETPYFDTKTEILDRDSKIPNTSGIKTDDIIFLNNIDYYSKGKVLSISILDPGTNYTSTNNISPIYSIDSPSNLGNGLILSYTDNSGIINSVTIVNPGLDYEVNDILYIDSSSGGTGAKIKIDTVDKNIVRLSDTYKVVSNSFGTIVLKDLINGTNSVIAGLTANGVFRTSNAGNRWNYLNKTKIVNTKIKSGFFRRSNISNSLIQDLDYDTNDKDYNNLSKIKNLVISDIIFSDNGNIMSSATYINSSILGGTDIWNNGIIQNSIINGIIFDRGIIKESNWVNGIFNGGLFYNSRSYNGVPSNINPYYYDNRIKSYYKDGITSATISNNRYSWKNGTFNSGEFFKSDWENGRFIDGLFTNSKWYNGTASGGQFGDESTSTEDTVFYNGTVDYTIVNNAKFYSDDSSNLGENKSIITWNDGIFNKGIFGSNLTKYYVATQSTIPKQTISINNVTGISEITIPVSENNTNIKEIELSINFSSQGKNVTLGGVPFTIFARLSQLIINLKSPNGKVINIKSEGTGSSNNLLSNTIFTTSEEYLNIDSGSPHYTGKFKIDNNIGIDGALPPNKISNTSNLSDLIDATNGINGNWYVVILLKDLLLDNPPAAYTFNYNIDATIKFITEDKTILKTTQNDAIWNDGIFKGGQFIDSAVWKNGIFNGGKFISTYGSLESGSYSVIGTKESHTWQNGIFNGGEFGNGSTGSNSTWYNGEFNYGLFKGRVWSNGVFRYGDFTGSGKIAIGGTSSNDHIIYGTPSNANSFANSYENDFYGLWRNGIVTNKKDIYVDDKKFYTEAERSDKLNNTNLVAKFNSILWQNGTFDNPDGEFYNSLWLGGSFKKGKFNLSSFNPYINGRFNIDDLNCYWENGDFTESEFYYSKWLDGKFISGTASGMIFENGIAYYMNAYNILWANGVWKNGNWNGSIFKYSGQITDDYQSTILDRVQSISVNYNSYKLHIWNIFDDTPSNGTLILSATPSDILTVIPTNTNPESTYYLPGIVV